MKAGWRGMKGRIYFKSVHAKLQLEKERREARLNAKRLYKEGRLYEAVDAISAVKSITPELMFMKSQLYYQLHKFTECVQVSKDAIGTTLYIQNYND